MFKKVELLSRVNHKDLTIDALTNLDFAKEARLVTLGLSEVSKLTSLLPVVISGGEDQQFIAFNALANQNCYFTTNRCQDIYLPMSLKGYPFTMVDSYEEGNDERKFRAVALDVESEFIGDDKSHKIFEDDAKLAKFAHSKVQMVQNLDKDKANSTRLINELNKLNLLDKRSFEIKIEDGSTKSLLSDFYVVNKQRLYELDDEVLVRWAKSGWLFAIESHMASISQINTLLQQLIKKDV
ncbi:MAG: SapC family protein [Campylobacterota bacterium]|nr:SapC family protein [Campylobacterota bacterium]